MSMDDADATELVNSPLSWQEEVSDETNDADASDPSDLEDVSYESRVIPEFDLTYVWFSAANFEAAVVKYVEMLILSDEDEPVSHEALALALADLYHQDQAERAAAREEAR